jgi:hypothetical protein
LVTVGKEWICGYSILFRPGADLDPEKAAARVEALVEGIRKIRSPIEGYCGALKVSGRVAWLYSPMVA